MATTPTPTPGYIHPIDKNYYLFQVAFASLDRPVLQYVKPTAIKSLILTDNFNNIFHKGTIVVDNKSDFIERADPSKDDKPFLFKGEARDIIHIDIMPLLNGDNLSDMGDEARQSVFRMGFDFVIYNSEEIPGDKPSDKYRRLHFHDFYYQLLSEKNIQFTTANYLQTPDVTSLDDTDRGIPSGLAIQGLLGEALPEADHYPIYISSFDGTGAPKAIVPITPSTIGNANAASSNNKNWDVGGTNIFYSTPAEFKAMDSVKYILNRHVSNVDSNFDQCFLRMERYPRAMSLKSLKQYFDQAVKGVESKELYLETLRIGGNDNDDAKDFSGHTFTPTDGLYFARIGTIKAYSFDNLAGLYSQLELVANFVHSYDYGSKQFNIDISRNSLKESMLTYKANYVDQMLGGASDGPYSNFAPGTIRSTNININNNFSVVNTDANARLAYGRNRFLYAATITNSIISFRVKGSTHRQAGRFIGVDRDGAMATSELDDKLLGVYFILEVKHIFEGNNYWNDLHCIKTYNTFKQPNTDDDGILSTIL
jgi:hypothetical protein